MADKSPKHQAPSTDEAADSGSRKLMHKQTAKAVHDGVELSWDMVREGELEPDQAAEFYVSSVEALKQFKDRDPRSEPALRKAKKQKEERGKAFGNLLFGVFVGLVLAALFGGGARGCDASYDNRGRYYGR